MLFDDNVVADGKAETSPFSRRFCREEWIEHLLLHVGRDAGAVITDPDLHSVSETLRRRRQARLKAIAGIRLAFHRRIETVRDHVQESAGNVLRKNIGFARRRIKQPLNRNFETLLLRPRTVPGEVQAFIDNGVDVDRPVFARGFPRVNSMFLTIASARWP